MSRAEMGEAVAYLRVSTQEQGESRAGLDAQRFAIERSAEARGWSLIAVEVDSGVSGKSLAGRPALGRALGEVERGSGRVLVVSKLDRLSRSVVDFATLLERSRRKGWGLVALDLGVDTTTSAGELVANVMVSVAQWERRVIGDRTREGLAARRAAGVRLGRPPALDAGTESRIQTLRASGLNLSQIAEELNQARVPTAHGGARWWPSTVRAVLVRSQG